MWKCQQCDERIEDPFETCWSCGTGKDGSPPEPAFEKMKESASRMRQPSTPEPEEYVCADCGAKVRYEDNICPSCSADVSEIESETRSAQQTEKRFDSDKARDSAPPVPRRRDKEAPTGQAIRRYKVVPFSAAVSSHEDPSHLAAQVEGIISSYASRGWEYVGVHQLQTFKAGSSGCFGLGATQPTSITTEFVVFRR